MEQAEDGEPSLTSLFLNEEYAEQQWSNGGVVQKFRSLAASSTDFDLTGQIVWGAAKTLAALIVARNEEFRLKNVLELGAGAGLSGLVASQYAQKVYLTDGNDIVVNLLRQNLQFAHCPTEALLYAWGEEGDKLFNVLEHPIDIIIGADILFWPQSIEPLAHTLAHHFSANQQLKVYIALRTRAQNIESLFDEALKVKGLKRIELDAVKILQQPVEENTLQMNNGSGDRLFEVCVASTSVI